MDQEQPTTCPACGNPATGKFCSSCGVILHASCPSCGAQLGVGSKFCHECGNAIARSFSRSRKPWIVGGAVVAVIALAAVVWYNATRDRINAPNPTGFSAVASTDISQMSLREQSDRLFNRVMAAQERGDQSEVDFFVPMAIQAYGLMGELDSDARYHLGLLHTVGELYELALLQADSLDVQSPGHLFAAMLRGSVASARGETTDLRAAHQSFLDLYDRELATGKPEYEEHTTSISIFVAEARSNVTRQKN